MSPQEKRRAETRRIVVFDTTLRDGEQAAGVCFSLEDKVEIARALESLRVDVIEAGFPSASPSEASAVAAVAQQVRGAQVCALARATPRDVDTAWEAVRHAAAPRVHVFVGSSDVNLRHQLRRGRDDVEALVRDCVKRAHGYVDNVEFSPLDATRTDPVFLARIVRAALDAGARTINLPDTVGCARPDQVARMIERLRSDVPEVEDICISFHGQDDLGLATANSLAAIAAGATQVEVAVNGIGERAGNTALEEVVMAISVHGAEMGVDTGVDSRGICPVSRIVEERSGIPVPPNKAVVGGNAFRHASGIHQDGVIKHRETFETLDPAAIGHARGSEIVLGKLSGRHGFAVRVAAAGIELSEAEVAAAFHRFQARADAGGVVDDAELRAICGAVASSPEAWPGPGV
jgi:2-isopropylmalate synthase